MLAAFLQFIDYQTSIRTLSTELYIVALALLFTGLGLWAGYKITYKEKAPSTFEVNQKALDYLDISEREYEVLELLSEGMSNKEIAGKLFVSVNTIKTHLAHLYQKLEVTRRTQAVQKAKSLRIIP